MCESMHPFPVRLHGVVLYSISTVTDTVSSESSVSYLTVEFYGYNFGLYTVDSPFTEKCS
jgi:hypothetical protein